MARKCISRVNTTINFLLKCGISSLQRSPAPPDISTVAEATGLKDSRPSEAVGSLPRRTLSSASSPKKGVEAEESDPGLRPLSREP